MGVGSAISTAVVLTAGVLLAVAATICRAGRSPAARFWVRRTPLEDRSNNPYAEVTVLVVLPLLAQLLVVVGVLIGLRSIPALRGEVLDGVCVAALVIEAAVCLVVLLATVYRTVMPLMFYPTWLRPQRAQERALLRSRRSAPHQR